MNEKDFELLVESIQEGGKILRKEKEPARTFVFSPPDIKGIRKNVKATQIEFASMIGVSVAILRNWEQGRRTPEGPALALLKVASEDPQYIKKILNR
ncbi:MAG: helix-turn-helix domain-containing protein [Sphaerochaeta sp.]|jgi:putative transcriptional regulator|uniref:helix-turn-helix domain-containing protein n=1 Tax=Sphaerochaeta sp. TaxID=1972642 RepID=UPI001EBF6FA9|nr:helix-turn-helix domain-containing protein [Spirochaetaceae bacterium]